MTSRRVLIAIMCFAAAFAGAAAFRKYREFSKERHLNAEIASQARVYAADRHRRELALEYDDLAISSQRKADEIKIDTLRIEDHIAELEGGAAHNQVAIVTLQSKWEADDLYKSEEQQLIHMLYLYERTSIDIQRALQAQTDAVLDSIIEERQANANGNASALDAATIKVKTTRQQLLNTLQQYQATLAKAQNISQ